MDERNLPVQAIMKLNPQNYGSLGAEIRISPKAKVDIIPAGAEVKYFVDTVHILIGIGEHNVAHVIMDTVAWEALKAGGETNVITLKDFKERFL